MKDTGVRTVVGVMARAPLAGRCKARLLEAHSPAWATGLYAAMLRDTLDGLQSVSADVYLVFAAPVPPAPDEPEDREAATRLAFEVLTRHVPAPWELVAQEGADLGARVEHAFAAMFARGATYALLAGSDAPSFPADALVSALEDASTRSKVLLGPSEDGGYYVLGMPRPEPGLLRDLAWAPEALRAETAARCEALGLGLRELAPWYDVDSPPDVVRLADELRRHPERAPRTAQFLVTNA